jgi:hypothetical protein
MLYAMYVPGIYLAYALYILYMPGIFQAHMLGTTGVGVGPPKVIGLNVVVGQWDGQFNIFRDADNFFPNFSRFF